MKKKEFLNLQSRYSYLSDCMKRHRKELNDFINDAFEKHGNVFEFKCETHETWEEREKDPDSEFDAMEAFPTYINVGIDDNYIHEIYPYCIRRTDTVFGYISIEVDGWDWYDSEWVEDLEINYSIDSLESVASFIHAVLEQEHKNQVPMKDRIDWASFKSELQSSLQNEKLWALGDESNESVHLENMARIEHEIQCIEDGDYDSILEYYDESVFDGHLIK